jgi:hypothetical protein
VAGFDSSSKEARRAMRKLLAHDNHRFFCSACRILKGSVETAGHEYLTRLLLEGDLLLAWARCRGCHRRGSGIARSLKSAAVSTGVM